MDQRNSPFGGAPQDQQDFVDRYRQGPQAVSRQEAAARYEQVAPQLPPGSTSSRPRTFSPS